MKSIQLSELNERLFEMDRNVGAFVSECQSGLVREETYQAAIRSIRAVTDSHSRSYLAPKYAVSQILRLAHYLSDDAPRNQPRGEQMVEMSRRVWRLLDDVLAGGNPPIPPSQDPTFTADIE